jgi:hypothetical protein
MSELRFLERVQWIVTGVPDWILVCNRGASHHPNMLIPFRCREVTVCMALVLLQDDTHGPVTTERGVRPTALILTKSWLNSVEDVAWTGDLASPCRVSTAFLAKEALHIDCF